MAATVCIMWQQPSYPWGVSAANGAQGAVAAAGMPPPTYNPYTGQPDYSAAWAEYYRRQGMHEYADAILRQAQQPQAAVQPAAPIPAAHMQAAQPAAPVPVQGQAAPGQYDYSQWQQWQQWQAWQQAWQQQQAGAPGQPAQAMPNAPTMPGAHSMQSPATAPGPGHPMPQ